MKVYRHFLELLLLLVASDTVRAKPFWDYYFPDNSAISIVPSIQTHEEHSSHYYPFEISPGNDLSQFVFFGQSRFLDDIIGNSKRKKFSFYRSN